MKVICISGKAGHGKDSVASIMKWQIEESGHSVLITHYGDLVKYICSNFFSWNGKKDDAGRMLLQTVGTDIVRKKQPDYWVNFVSDMLKFFSGMWDYVLIPDTRFPNEISRLIEDGFDVYHLRVIRPDYNSPLTEDQKKHASEISLDDSAPDATIINRGTVADLSREVEIFLSNLASVHQTTLPSEHVSEPDGQLTIPGFE